MITFKQIKLGFNANAKQYTAKIFLYSSVLYL